MIKNKISITIGIPTYLAGEHLISALNSIYQNSNIDLVDQVLIAADGKKISGDILRKIKHRKLKVIGFKNRSGQSQRMNDLMRFAKSDILILSNDDVIFDKHAVESVISTYKSSRADLISARVYPLKPRSFLERILEASENIKSNVVQNFADQKTYLSTNGRFFALSKKLYKRLVLPRNLVNSDAFIYFYSTINKYSSAYIQKIVCYFREPSTINEYINQVHKFQMSHLENGKYFDKKLLAFGYKVPFLISAKANIEVLYKSPGLVLMYYTLFVYVRVINLLGLNDSTYIKLGYWKTDISTKSL